MANFVESWGYKGDYMQDLQSKLEYVRSKIEGKVSHPFLAQKIEAPLIDEDKLLLLVSFLDYLDMPLNKIELYAVPTMLLQIALDTHEKVTNDMTDLQNRQLTILAGTYYSGLYYKILADYGEIEVIRLLAEGIETINDQKIIVYQQEMDGIENLMESVKNIESSLYRKLTAHLHANTWGEVVSNLLFIKRLFEEKEQFVESNSSVLFDALKKLAFPKQESQQKDLSNEQKNYLLLICDKYINFAKELLMKAKSKLPLLNEAVDGRIDYFLNQHQPIAKSLVEEG